MLLDLRQLEISNPKLQISNKLQISKSNVQTFEY